jgi:hypothetical protein
MTEQTENIVLELLRNIRADIARVDKRQQEATLKIEALAGSIVSLRNDFGVLDMKVSGLTSMVDGLRADIRTIAIAVDGHASRLDKMETLLDAMKH